MNRQSSEIDKLKHELKLYRKQKEHFEMLNEFNSSFITAKDDEVIMHKRAAQHESRRYIDI